MKVGSRDDAIWSNDMEFCGAVVANPEYFPPKIEEACQEFLHEMEIWLQKSAMTLVQDNLEARFEKLREEKTMENSFAEKTDPLGKYQSTIDDHTNKLAYRIPSYNIIFST